MIDILKRHLSDMGRFTWQGKAWIALSGFVLIVISFFICFRKRLIIHGLLLPIGISGIILSVIWWYWAMNVIYHLIEHRKEETLVLIDLYKNMISIKENSLLDLPIDKANILNNTNNQT